MQGRHGRKDYFLEGHGSEKIKNHWPRELSLFNCANTIATVVFDMRTFIDFHFPSFTSLLVTPSVANSFELYLAKCEGNKRCHKVLSFLKKFISVSITDKFISFTFCRLHLQ